MKKLILFAALILPFGMMAQSFTITTPDSQQFKMEMEGFEDPTQQNSSNSSTQQTVQAEWAKVEGNTIILPDGRTLNWSYSDIDGLVGCEIEMKEPVGAKVVLTYEDKTAYSSEAPFFYREKAFQFFSSYFKLTVVEPSGSAWVVKLQNKKNKKITITSGGSNSTGTTATGSTEQPVEVNNDGGCSIAMGSAEFNRALESIRGKTFEDTKLDVAKQITRANCMSAEQIKMVMRAFEFEDTRLEYAIFAYKYCVDQNQYYLVNEAFEFELTIEELQEYLDDQY